MEHSRDRPVSAAPVSSSVGSGSETESRGTSEHLARPGGAIQPPIRAQRQCDLG
jgi:hypothetical protein